MVNAGGKEEREEKVMRKIKRLVMKRERGMEKEEEDGDWRDGRGGWGGRRE